MQRIPVAAVCLGMVVAVVFGCSPEVRQTRELTMDPASRFEVKTREPEIPDDVDPEITPELLELMSYRTGFRVGLTWAQQEMEPDLDQLLRGIEDGMAGNDQPLPPREMEEAHELFMRKLAVRRHSWAPRNLAESTRFLTANGEREGVESLPSGLQYEVVVQGTGPKPTLDDRVTVQYRAYRVDGREFQSSHYRGEPAVFALADTIEGWKEGITMMPEGSTWKLFLPPDLAYGEAGHRGFIQPNDALIYEIELLGIEAPEASPGAG